VYYVLHVRGVVSIATAVACPPCTANRILLGQADDSRKYAMQALIRRFHRPGRRDIRRFPNLPRTVSASGSRSRAHTIDVIQRGLAHSRGRCVHEEFDARSPAAPPPACGNGRIAVKTQSKDPTSSPLPCRARPVQNAKGPKLAHYSSPAPPKPTPPILGSAPQNPQGPPLSSEKVNEPNSKTTLLRILIIKPE